MTWCVIFYKIIKIFRLNLNLEFTNGKIKQSNIGKNDNFYIIIKYVAKTLDKIDDLEQ